MNADDDDQMPDWLRKLIDETRAEIRKSFKGCHKFPAALRQPHKGPFS